MRAPRFRSLLSLAPALVASGSHPARHYRHVLVENLAKSSQRLKMPIAVPLRQTTGAPASAVPLPAAKFSGTMPYLHFRNDGCVRFPDSQIQQGVQIENSEK